MPHPLATELARRLRRNETAAEAAAWELLRARRCHGLKFRRQVVLYGFVVDLYSAELKLAIELDGAIHDVQGVDNYDRSRTEHLARHGVRVMRIRNHELDVQMLYQAVEQAGKSPPLHER
ncbi:MAG TPA: DUF559 domain-containing protein, partial [Gemmatimonadales bacterium]|nr:DUF559 domain-containing protein [Gemmatimonadales bacterium]